MKSPNELKAHQRRERHKWVLGRWTHYMTFNNISSGVEREHPLGGVAMNAKGKGFGREAFQSVIRV
jgi:hypothetical protein